MEPDAERVQQGDLSWVGDSRPSVDAWFDHFADRTLFLNGVVVPSVSHVTCTKLLYLSNLGTAPDWPSRLGHAGPTASRCPRRSSRGPTTPTPWAPRSPGWGQTVRWRRCTGATSCAPTT